jgi:imidazolonepropionase
MFLTNARILTLASADASAAPGPRRGRAMRELGVIARGSLVVRAGRIDWIGEGRPPAERTAGLAATDLGGRVLLPAFTDCHTHACFAGERYGEMAMRLAGTPYLDILAAGGGIMSTVRSVREATTDELAANLLARLALMRRAGTAHAEVKSGYGLDTATELRMLEAIAAVAATDEGLVSPTFLGAHAVDGEPAAYARLVTDEMLPAVVARFGAIPCDAYCEKGAWSRDDTRTLLERARALGCPLRLHVDQFHELGALGDALALGARTVDHLEATSPAMLDEVARSGTIAVLLPGSGLSLDLRFADGRRLIDAGAAVAIATNMNPGSSPLVSMPLAIALASRFYRFDHAEAIVAATWNAACVLGLERETGSLEVGKRADLVVLPTGDERALAYEWSSVAPEIVIVGGGVVAGGERLAP